MHRVHRSSLDQAVLTWGPVVVRPLVDRADDVGPAGYRLASEEQRALVRSLTALLAEAGALAESGPGDAARGAPRPEPVARIVPPD